MFTALPHRAAFGLMTLVGKRLQHMKIKNLAIIAAVFGSLCIVYAFWVQDVSVPLLAGISATGGSFKSIYFWRPLCVGLLFWILAGTGFMWSKRNCSAPVRPDDETSDKAGNE